MESELLSALSSTLDTAILDLNLDASFIQNGGHSLTAAALVSACKASGCHLTSKSVLASPSIRELVRSARPAQDSELQPMVEHSKKILLSNSHNDQSDWLPEHQDLRNKDHRPFLQIDPSPQSPVVKLYDTSHSNETIRSEPKMISSSASPPHEPENQDLLTDMQLSLVHGTLKTPGMNIITYSETYYTREIPAVKRAWQKVISQEPIFNSSAFDQFRRQSYETFLWHEEPSVRNEAELLKAIEEMRDASQIGSVFHVFPHKPAGEQESISTVTWIVHHAFIDGFSATLLLQKVRQITAGQSAGPSLPFCQFSSDLQNLRRSLVKEGNAYWAKSLELRNIASGQLLLPAVTEDLAQARCDEIVVDIKAVRGRLDSVAREMNVTSATLYNTAWALVLSKYADSSTVTFGVVLSGRDLPLAGVKEIIGPLINTHPLSVKIDPGLSASAFISSVMEALAELAEFQWTTPENGFSNDFDSALAVQFGQLEPPKDAIRPIGKTHTQQAIDVPLSIMVEPDGRARFIYHRQRYSKASMERLGACYYQALQMFLRENNSVHDILQGLVPLSSRDMLLKFGNCLSDRTTRGSITQDLVTLFEQSALKVPDNFAVQKADQSLTYADLDHAASLLAEYLSKVISPGEIVAVHSDRSINWIIAIYTILKVGATYCSLDSELPSELRDNMYASAGIKAFIAPYATQRGFRPASCEIFIALDETLKSMKGTRASVLSHRKEPKPWSVAYLCFTSGSTGSPKGVICTHEGLVAFQSQLEVRLYAQPGIKISQVMSPAFDGSIHEIFSALSYGATLVLPQKDDPFGHLASVDSAILTPSIARVLDPELYARLCNVYLVGEPVPQSVNDKWSRSKKLYNMYGPTEGTCGATIKRLLPGARVTIGAPNPSTRTYILDSHGEMAIPGVIGEIYIAGVQVAKGYINLPDETGSKFLRDHISCNGEQMYRTGDKGYWLESGEIVCLGRSDRQIKLRGYRLDMNDLEVRIAKAFPTVEAVAIAPKGDYLVGMVQPASIDVKELLSHVSMALPPYAIPQHVMATDTLPTTRAGKIDYKTMTEMVFTASTQETREPSTSTERTVAVAFKRVLELDQLFPITAQSNFIALGGHSLQQLSLSLCLTRELGAHIPLQIVIENPAVGDLAKAVDSLISHEDSRVSRVQSLDEQSVSLLETDWLKRYKFDAGSSSFNVSFTSSFTDGVVNITRLVDAWNTVLASHPLLRCRYITGSGKAPRRVFSDHATVVERVKGLDLWVEINRPFQLDRANPVRVHIADDRLVVVLSHIVADYTTLSILLTEASALYNGQSIPSVRSNYLEMLRQKEITKPCHLEFWSKYLEGCVDSPELFGRKAERNNYRGTSFLFELPTTLVSKLHAYTQSTSFTLQQLATAAVALCLQPETTNTDMVILTPYINRSSDKALETVGLFLEPLPIRVKYDSSAQSKDENGKPISFLESVRNQSQAALAHAVPWHQLLDRLAVKRRYPNHPLSDVMVSFHDSRQVASLSVAAPGFESCYLWSEGSKFKLMCEFTAVAGRKVLLRLEYDPNCVGREDVRMLKRCVPEALRLLVERADTDEIKQRIVERKGDVDVDDDITTKYFGIKMSDV